jgi:hypothetical protein
MKPTELKVRHSAKTGVSTPPPGGGKSFFVMLRELLR